MNFLSGAEISCPLSVLQRVRIIEVIFTKNVWAFSRDQENCPYYRGVRIREVSVMRGSTVYRNYQILRIVSVDSKVD